MLSIADNPFLQGLGFAIANSLWQFAGLWLVYSIATYVVRLHAANKYRLAVALQTIGFIWFLFSFFVSYHAAAEQLAIMDALSAHGNVEIVMASGNENGWQNLWQLSLQKIAFVLPYLSTAYLLILVLLIVRFAQGYRQVQVLRTKGLQKMDVRMRMFVDRLSAELNIGRKVKVYLSELVNSPVTVGFLKPVILVPVASFNQLTTYQLEAVLLHELAHIKRYDYVVHVGLRFIETILFFNPFMRLMRKEIQSERENCCDDWVLQYQYQPADYAAALLRIAQQAATPALAMSANGHHKKHLLARIKRIVQVDAKQRFNYREQLLSLSLLTCIICLVSWYKPVKEREKIAEKVKKIDASKLMVKKAGGVFEISVNALAELQKALPEMKAGINDAFSKLNNVHFILPLDNTKAEVQSVDAADENVADENVCAEVQNADVRKMDDEMRHSFLQARVEVAKAKRELSQLNLDEQLSQIKFFTKVDLGNSMNALMTQLDDVFKKTGSVKMNFRRNAFNVAMPRIRVLSNATTNHSAADAEEVCRPIVPVVPNLVPNAGADGFTVDIDSSLRVYIRGDLFKQVSLRLNRLKTQRQIQSALLAEKRIAFANQLLQSTRVREVVEDLKRRDVHVKINHAKIVEVKVNENEEVASTEKKVEEGNKP